MRNVVKNTIRLSNKELWKLPPNQLVGDGAGLFLSIKAGGSRSWLFMYSHPVTHKRTSIGGGSLKTVSLAQARQWRDEMRLLLDKGIDPKSVKHAP